MPRNSWSTQNHLNGIFVDFFCPILLCFGIIYCFCFACLFRLPFCGLCVLLLFVLLRERERGNLKLGGEGGVEDRRNLKKSMIKMYCMKFFSKKRTQI